VAKVSGPSGGSRLAAPAESGPADPDLFTRSVQDYAAQRPGQPIMLLQAGCTTAYGTVDVAALRAAGCDIVVSLVDDDQRVARAAAQAHADLASCTLGDLRTLPLAPRSFDIVHCSLLLERIALPGLVLDRFVDSLKPGGLLLLQTGDRDCAAGFLDRALPRPVRALIWKSLRPGEPGPYPAVYEQPVSGRGIQSYVQRGGLVIAQRQELNVLAGRSAPRWLLLARAVVARLSRARLTAGHDELRYVIRKPEDRFARVL
jgi:SAM-dependent methyltransferase